MTKEKPNSNERRNQSIFDRNWESGRAPFKGYAAYIGFSWWRIKLRRTYERDGIRYAEVRVLLKPGLEIIYSPFYRMDHKLTCVGEVELKSIRIDGDLMSDEMFKELREGNDAEVETQA